MGMNVLCDLFWGDLVQLCPFVLETLDYFIFPQNISTYYTFIICLIKILKKTNPYILHILLNNADTNNTTN